MEYQVSVDWAEAFELSASLTAYFSKNPKTLDMGPAWAQEARERGDAAIAHLAPQECGKWLDIVIWRCPGPRDAPGFIAWLAGVGVGDLYELLAPFADGEHFPLPDNLGVVRDGWVHDLTAWHWSYFRHIDPAILRGLAAEAEARRAIIAQQAPEDAIEQATGGIRFTPPANVAQVLLVPQYHYRPVNLYCTCRGWRLFLYPHDALPPAPGAPSQALLRLTRALDDTSRLHILRHLAGGKHTFTEIVAATGLAKSTVHHHMVLLRAAGLVFVHDLGSGGEAYSLRQRGLADLADRLGSYLSPSEGNDA